MESDCRTESRSAVQILKEFLYCNNPRRFLRLPIRIILNFDGYDPQILYSLKQLEDQCWRFLLTNLELIFKIATGEKIPRLIFEKFITLDYLR
jgi:hypothetical protein